MMLNRVSLNTIGLNRIGLNRIGKPSRASSDRPYIDPEVLASLKAVCICYGKSNDDPDRAVVKNLVDPDNPFVISNAAYTEGSGYADKGSPYYGAFVTDGINDLITSTKTVQEMLGGSNEITVVSLITHISGTGKYNIIGDGGIQVSDYSGQTFMAGTSSSGEKIVELGDKEKLQAVQYTTFDSKLTIGLEDSSYAYYGTFVFNKENVPVDWIHQVIAYFNLDRTLNPDILCNTIKQGITNENHAEFGDKLIDFSGNGRDIQLNNLAWKGDSGIGKYEENFLQSWWTHSAVLERNSFRVKYKGNIGFVCYKDVSRNPVAAAIPSFKVSIEGAKVRYGYINSDGVFTNIVLDEGVQTVPQSFVGTTGYVGFLNAMDFTNSDEIITITQIPSHAGALCLDGVNDFGKVTGMPIYKDYTFIIEREFLNETFPNQLCLVSKSKVASEIENGGAFIVDNISVNSIINPYSFYKPTGLPGLNTFDRQIVFQSKYKYLDKDIAAGTATDSDTLWLGTFRDNDSRFANVAIYSLMSFPYSMSKFLIERQLKKHKLGTLYPDMVEFRPVITINGESGDISYANDKWENINIGDYINIGEIVHILFYRKDIEEISNVKVNGAKFQSIDFDSIYNHWNINIELTSKSPQKIDITIDEYIRFEDIAQPYPVLLRFKDENGNEVSWGGKFRVGSTITRIKSFYENNLLDGLYIVRNPRLNGNNLITPTHVVEKSMVFTCDTEYLLDNNEPKCILSPRLLRIPNSSYKILGHIPDISGHGNHGKINNSAYKLNSGVNGYLVDFTTLKDDGIKGIVRTDSKIYLDKSFNYNQGFWLGRTNNPSPAYKVKVSGIPETGMLTYTGGVWLNLVNGINELPARTNTEEEHGFVIQSPNLDWSNLVIEQIGEYEGAYCLDGVNDHVTIPTVTGGGKQVLMKVNNNTINSILYDQRSSGASPNSLNRDFAICTTDTDNNNLIAYQSRLVGKTYIDGILNTNITCEDLLGVLHNITITCDIVVPNNGVVPNIGRGGVLKDLYSKVALYDFMLFDEISTEDKIKELNEYIGIEAKVELPPYYYDAYGKTNLDEDKAIIQQRGIAVGDYDITNYNHAYDKMSGYGGYAFAKFDNTSEWNLIRNSTGIEVVSRNGYSCTLKRVGSNVWDFGNSSNRKIGKDLNVNIKCDKNIKIKWQLKYKTTENPDTEITVELVNDSIGPNPKSITLPHKTDEELTTLGAIESSVYYLVYFDSSTLPIGEEYTVEMLPLYPNGLVYDGVTDYSENTNIPAFTDYTYIIKRENLNNNVNSATMYKGNKAGGGAFIVDYIASNGSQQYSYGNPTLLPLNENTIIYGTKTSYNGSALTVGSNADENGLDIGHWSSNYKSIVLYKLILYPKTIPLLQINFLKNLMERDEIIDLDNKIFIQE